MRKVLWGATVAALSVGALPATGHATTYPAPLLSMTAEPSALPPGNNFTVRGYCASDPGTPVSVRLVRQARAGRDESVVATKHTKTTNGPELNGEWSVTFANNLVPTPGFSIDAKLFAECNGHTAQQPFVSTQLAYPGNRQTILTAQITPRCERCPPHLKGFDAFGNLANANHTFKSNWTSIGSIVNDPLDTGNEDRPPGDRVITRATLSSGPGMTVTIGSGSDYGDQSGFFDGFTGGSSMATGKFYAAIRGTVLGAGPGGGPHVKLFGTHEPKGPTATPPTPVEDGSFFAYAADFRGGVRVAVGDVLGDDNLEIITAPGPGGGPHIKVFDTDGHLLTQFFAYGPNMTGGVSLSVGDVVPGGKKEIVTGAGPGGAPHVRTFTGDGTPIGNGFYAYAESFTGGVNVSVGDVDHQGGADIVTGAGPGGMPHVRWFTSVDGAFTTPGFYAYEDVPTGVLVAAESS